MSRHRIDVKFGVKVVFFVLFFVVFFLVVLNEKTKIQNLPKFAQRLSQALLLR